MAELNLRARGPADTDLAWERYADPQLWSTWAPQIQRVETDMQRLRPGGRGVVRAGVLPHPTLGIRFSVLAVDEDARSWVWKVALGPVRLLLEHGVEPDGNGTVTTLRLRGPLPVLLAYAPVARFALGRLVAA